MVFLLTGQYMDWYHQQLMYMADGPRMLYRTRHIFILMSGLLHVGLGTYFRLGPTATRRALQISVTSTRPRAFAVSARLNPLAQVSSDDRS